MLPLMNSKRTYVVLVRNRQRSTFLAQAAELELCGLGSSKPWKPLPTPGRKDHPELKRALARGWVETLSARRDRLA